MQRQPLFSARERAHRRKRGQLLWLFVGALAVSLLGTALVYWAAPAPRPAEDGAKDGTEELRVLLEEPSPAFCRSQGAPLVCAHGGLTSAAPPNTARAFQAAVDAGVRCVEVDVVRTKDGQLVVLHTRELLHLLHLRQGKPVLAAWQQAVGSSRKAQQPQVGDFTWEQLRRLQWEGGEGVERVQAVLGIALGPVKQVTLDVKTYMQGGEDIDEDIIAQQVVDLVVATPGCAQRCLVWAKSDRVVEAVKTLAPHVRVGYVVLNETEEARAAGMDRPLRLPQAEVVALHHAMASPPLISQLRSAGKEVHAWTANTAEMMTRVLEAGVDAVVTNRARDLLTAIQSRAAVCKARRLASL